MVPSQDSTTLLLSSPLRTSIVAFHYLVQPHFDFDKSFICIGSRLLSLPLITGG